MMQENQSKFPSMKVQVLVSYLKTCISLRILVLSWRDYSTAGVVVSFYTSNGDEYKDNHDR